MKYDGNLKLLKFGFLDPAFFLELLQHFGMKICPLILAASILAKPFLSSDPQVA